MAKSVQDLTFSGMESGSEVGNDDVSTLGRRRWMDCEEIEKKEEESRCLIEVM